MFLCFIYQFTGKIRPAHRNVFDRALIHLKRILTQYDEVCHHAFCDLAFHVLLETCLGAADRVTVECFLYGESGRYGPTWSRSVVLVTAHCMQARASGSSTGQSVPLLTETPLFISAFQL